MFHIIDFKATYLLILITLTISIPLQRDILKKDHIVQENKKNSVRALNSNLNAERLTETPYLRFSKIPNEVEITEEDRLILKCEAVGIPQPVIEWVRNDNVIHAVNERNAAEKLNNAALSTIQYGVTVSKMVLPCIRTKETAEYKCLANNNYQKIESAAIVVTEDNTKCSKKHSLPIISMWTDARFERSGATVQLFCRVDGTAQPNITWYDERNSRLDDIKKYKILPSGDLIIYDTQWEDMGIYTCIASNEYGQDQIMAFFYPTKP